jgi:hypothetical protein
MKWIGKKFAGLEALCRYYQELGIDASILPDDSPEAVQRGFLVQDLGYIKIGERNFNLVTVRMKSSRGYGCAMGPIPIPLAWKEKTRFQYHHIVRPSHVDEVASKAKLKKKKKGLFSKEIVAVTWKGGSLATTLNADPEIERALLNFLTTEDDLSINPDKKNNVVRIVFSRPAEMKVGLLQGFKFDRRLYPEEAIDVIDKIAGLIR